MVTLLTLMMISKKTSCQLVRYRAMLLKYLACFNISCTLVQVAKKKVKTKQCFVTTKMFVCVMYFSTITATVFLFIKLLVTE